jgi:predicted RNA-binding protein YlqC (UPF0109 family)
MTEQLKGEEYLSTIISPLLTESAGLIINRTQDDKGILLSVQVAKKDMGVIIGKGGETASSIRRIMHQYGSKTQERLSVKFDEPTV